MHLECSLQETVRIAVLSFLCAPLLVVELAWVAADGVGPGDLTHRQDLEDLISKVASILMFRQRVVMEAVEELRHTDMSESA